MLFASATHSSIVASRSGTKGTRRRRRCADGRRRARADRRFDRHGEQAKYGVAERAGLAREREDRAVVRGIRRPIEDVDARRADRSRKCGDDVGAASLADVGYAFNQRHSPLVSQLILPHNFFGRFVVNPAIYPSDNLSMRASGPMSDPLRTNPIESTASTDGDAERDAKIETLLLAGLDQYFAADYAQAIDIWTRVMFLDRNHARARAYIERARSAMPEQQVSQGAASQRRGGVRAGRDRSGEADVERRGATWRRARGGARIPHAHRPHPRGDVSAADARSAGVETAIPAADCDVAQARIAVGERRVRGAARRLGGRRHRLVGSASRLDTALNTGPAGALAPMRMVQEPLIVPRSSETALDRARALFESGRAYDALRAVDLVRPTDPLRSDADKLKAAIQRELLAFETSPGGAELTGPPSPQSGSGGASPAIPTTP